MAYDPRREDYQRMGLRFARTLSGADPFGAAQQMLGFGRRFQAMRDTLPQSDEDRAFHLVVEATDIVDYQLPFVADEAVPEMLDEAGRLLEEALELDSACHDARRMLEAAQHPSFESYYRFLEAGSDGVRADCERKRERLAATAPNNEAQLAANIAMRPYIRWTATRATKALICGRYRQCISIGEELLNLDPADQVDARFTLALAYAKLEDEAGLDTIAKRYTPLETMRAFEDPWMNMSRLALAHKRRDLASARTIVHEIVSTYPQGALTLFRQDELPDGVFGRLAVAPGSEDELILAVSEATVLLQEGRDLFGRGSLGSWVAAQNEVQAAADTPDPREMSAQ